MSEEVVESKTPKRYAALTQSSSLQKLNEVETQDIYKRQTGISEFDRVLGGGFVAGGVILLGGDPGIGKSTILIQALSVITQQPSESCNVIYVSGEE